MARLSAAGGLAATFGFDTHVVKPIDTDELYRAIEAVLGAQRSR